MQFRGSGFLCCGAQHCRQCCCPACIGAVPRGDVFSHPYLVPSAPPEVVCISCWAALQNCAAYSRTAPGAILLLWPRYGASNQVLQLEQSLPKVVGAQQARRRTEAATANGAHTRSLVRGWRSATSCCFRKLGTSTPPGTGLFRRGF